jgi:uncharacterized protein (TIGR02001 family)
MVNNYLFRGISRTDGGPAVRGGFDIAVPNGFYMGAWGSNTSWLSDKGFASNSSLELDTYAGIKNSSDTDLTYDFGILRYHYPAIYNAGMTNADTNEIYGAISFQWLAAKYSRSQGNAFGVANSKGTHYLDISANYLIPDSGVSLGAHYGKQLYQGDGANQLKASGSDPSYADYKVSISKNISGFVLGLAYSKTNAAKGAGAYYNVSATGKDLGRSATIFSLSRTF